MDHPIQCSQSTGEFLRGTGTNGHSEGNFPEGSGSDVGIHQGAKQHVRMCSVNGGGLFVYMDNTEFFSPAGMDAQIGTTTRQNRLKGTMESVSQNLRYTSRPTNTSVLFCIKY